MDSEGSTGDVDFSKMKVPELKKELKARGLSTTGNKNELVERLQNASKSKLDNNGDASVAESVDELDEDLLNDDDDEHLDGSDSALADIDGSLDVTSDIKGIKRTSDIMEKSQDEQPKPKKLVLNRTPSASQEPQPTNGTDLKVTLEKVDEEQSTSQSTNEKKVIKLSELGAKERLELRAKKFGVAPPPDLQKAARAERFGSTGTTESSKKISLTSPTPNLDALKQRAQRFGGSVSSVMSKMEELEKLEKRKARFGVVANSNGATTETDKAKMRLERFKQ